MIDLVVNNNCSYEITAIVESLTIQVLNNLELDNVSLSLNLVSDEAIQELNKTYRSKDSVTDVITFSYEDESNFNELFEVRELGDIFIAVDYVYRNSIKLGHSMAREMAFVIVHGILHTLGYDHQTEEEENVMFSLQEQLIANITCKGSELNAIFSR